MRKCSIYTESTKIYLLKNIKKKIWLASEQSNEVEWLDSQLELNYAETSDS